MHFSELFTKKGHYAANFKIKKAVYSVYIKITFGKEDFLLVTIQKGKK